MGVDDPWDDIGKIFEENMDGKIIAALIALAIIGIIAAQFISIKKTPVINGEFNVKPGLKSYIFNGSLVLMVLCICYAATQASPDQENIARLVGISFFVMMLILLYNEFFYRYRVNKEHLIQIPLIGTQKTYYWNDCQSLTGDMAIPTIHFKNKKIRCPTSLDGIQNFFSVLSLKFHSLDSSNFLVRIEPSIMEDMIGKRMLIGIAYIDEAYEFEKFTELYGTVKAAHGNHFTVALEGDQSADLTLPANFHCLDKFPKPRSVRLETADTTVENIEFTSQWFTSNPKWA